MLEIKSLWVSYGSIRALHGVSLDAKDGEIVVLVGSNGAGKSSLLKAVAGFVRPASGQVLINGEALTGAAETRARAGVALVPEGRQVWTELTVFEHLRLGFGAIHGPRRVFDERVAEIYELFPRLAERRRQKAGTLSGGEQQMVAIARALIRSPRVLLLDEPTLGLAPHMVEAIGESLAAARATDRAVILAEQNADFALRYADRGYVLEVGEVRTQGPAGELAKHPGLISACLGVELQHEDGGIS